MSKVRVCREHDLSGHECDEVAVQLLEKLVDKFGGHYERAGEVYNYKHNAGVKAVIEPKVGTFAVDVEFGIMSRFLAPQVEREMVKILDEYLQV